MGSVFSVYVLICLLWYSCTVRCKLGKEINKRKEKFLYQMCMLSVVMALGRLLADHTVAFLGWQSDALCVMSVSVSFVFYSCSLYPVYIFLWVKQSIFYFNPVLFHVLNPFVTLLSYGTLFLMVVGGLIITVLFVLPEVTGWEYQASPEGCKDVQDNAADFELIPAIMVIFIVIFQLCLLALFLYPLLTRKTKRTREKKTKQRAKMLVILYFLPLIDSLRNYSKSSFYDTSHCFSC